MITKHLFIYICLLFSVLIQAQKELNKTAFNVPPAAKPLVPEKSSSSVFAKPSPFAAAPIPSLFDGKPAPKNKFEIGGSSKINMTATTDFIKPGSEVEKKLNAPSNGQVSEDFKVVRGNQYLGDFKSKAKSVNVKYRDFGEVDGDDIRVYVNGKIIVSRIVLDYDYNGFKIDLQPGFNKIEFEALSQGQVGPNTAQFQVYDNEGNLIASNMWNLATGFKASIIVVKE